MTARVFTFPPPEPFGTCVVALGAFDGVHVGHRALLSDARADAASRGATAVTLTFDRDPDAVLHPDSATLRLLDDEDRYQRLLEAGADTVLVVPFTLQLARLDAVRFLETVVQEACHPVSLHVGRNFRFGAAGAGDLSTLTAWGARQGVTICAHDLIEFDGTPVSATRIRHLIAQGDVARARRLLTSPHRIRGVVTHGRGEGAALGFPTANLLAPVGIVLPADGVYAGRTLLDDGTAWPAAISVGRPPSYPEAHSFVEVHLMGFDGDLYGREVIVEFLARLRALTRFESPADLREAITDDVQRVRGIVEECPRPGMGARGEHE